MINEVSYEYAKSLFELSNDKLETFNCLETISSVLSDEVINVLTHPLINKNDKKEIINKSFSEYFNETFLHFLFVLIDNNRIDEINNIKNDFYELLKEEQEIIEILIESNYQLDNTELDNLKNKLENKYNKKVVLIPSINTNIIGGIKMTLKNEIFDASVNNYLNDLVKEIKG